MRRAALSVAILVGTSLAALADTGPVLVVPGRPGVPVIINGRDASYAVVEGDWGLAKHFHVQPTVYGGWDSYEQPPVGHYYPSLGRKPGYGRLEIEPPANRKLPQPAESYHKSYSAQYDKAMKKYKDKVWMEPSEAQRKAIVADQRKGRELAYAPTGTSLDAGKLMRRLSLSSTDAA